MKSDTIATLREFNALMAEVRKAVPSEFSALSGLKAAVTGPGRLPEKTKWLILLTASISQKCPVCIPQAVKHCLDAGWTREEILEGAMVGVLIGGSSVMTYVTLVERAIQDLQE